MPENTKNESEELDGILLPSSFIARRPLPNGYENRDGLILPSNKQKILEVSSDDVARYSSRDSSEDPYVMIELAQESLRLQEQIYKSILEQNDSELIRNYINDYFNTSVATLTQLYSQRTKYKTKIEHAESGDSEAKHFERVVDSLEASILMVIDNLHDEIDSKLHDLMDFKCFIAGDLNITLSDLKIDVDTSGLLKLLPELDSDLRETRFFRSKIYKLLETCELDAEAAPQIFNYMFEAGDLSRNSYSLYLYVHLLKSNPEALNNYHKYLEQTIDYSQQLDPNKPEDYEELAGLVNSGRILVVNKNLHRGEKIGIEIERGTSDESLSNKYRGIQLGRLKVDIDPGGGWEESRTGNTEIEWGYEYVEDLYLARRFYDVTKWFGNKEYDLTKWHGKEDDKKYRQRINDYTIHYTLDVGKYNKSNLDNIGIGLWREGHLDQARNIRPPFSGDDLEIIGAANTMELLLGLNTEKIIDAEFDISDEDAKLLETDFEAGFAHIFTKYIWQISSDPVTRLTALYLIQRTETFTYLNYRFLSESLENSQYKELFLVKYLEYQWNRNNFYGLIQTHSHHTIKQPVLDAFIEIIKEPWSLFEDDRSRRKLLMIKMMNGQLLDEMEDIDFKKHKDFHNAHIDLLADFHHKGLDVFSKIKNIDFNNLTQSQMEIMVVIVDNADRGKKILDLIPEINLQSITEDKIQLIAQLLQTNPADFFAKLNIPNIKDMNEVESAQFIHLLEACSRTVFKNLSNLPLLQYVSNLNLNEADIITDTKLDILKRFITDEHSALKLFERLQLTDIESLEGNSLELVTTLVKLIPEKIFELKSFPNISEMLANPQKYKTQIELFKLGLGNIEFANEMALDFPEGFDMDSIKDGNTLRLILHWVEQDPFIANKIKGLSFTDLKDELTSDQALMLDRILNQSNRIERYFVEKIDFKRLNKVQSEIFSRVLTLKLHNITEILPEGFDLASEEFKPYLNLLIKYSPNLFLEMYPTDIYKLTEKEIHVLTKFALIQKEDRGIKILRKMYNGVGMANLTPAQFRYLQIVNLTSMRASYHLIMDGIDLEKVTEDQCELLEILVNDLWIMNEFAESFAEKFSGKQASKIPANVKKLILMFYRRGDFKHYKEELLYKYPEFESMLAFEY